MVSRRFISGYTLLTYALLLWLSPFSLIGLFNYVVYLSGGTVINNGFYPSPTTPSYPTPSYPSPSYPTPSYPSPSGSNSGSGNSIAAAVARQNADLSARLAQQQADLMAAMKKQQEALLRAGPRIK